MVLHPATEKKTLHHFLIRARVVAPVKGGDALFLGQICRFEALLNFSPAKKARF
jgi:hypothetical protein